MGVEIQGLTVRFGGVRSLDDVTVSFEAGACGLVGPNGAGKTTFFNVLSGFVAPAAGRVLAFGEDLLAMAPHRRARWGLRRTFQQEQVIDELSVAGNLALALDHSAAERAGARAAIEAALEHVGLDVPPRTRARGLAMRQRRLLEIARAIVGHPRLVLLDEPGAGLTDHEAEHLAAVIRAIPERTGALVILVDHDMDLVSGCAASTAVLDFGRLIAAGPTGEVLRDERVRKAYLGTEEVA